jgi:1-deoxy-D-xylulose-5-phosphate reductoisomerase
MRIPISFALNYPKRNYYNFPRIDLIEIGKLSFSQPDTQRFPCLKYAYEALEIGGTAPAILNSANETAVQAFLQKRISFVQIPACIDFALSNIDILEEPSLEDVFETDRITRELTERFINKKN